MNPDVDMIDACPNSNTPTVQNQPDQNDASYSSQNSNTPTAQNEGVPNYGGADGNKYNIIGSVDQFNPTEGNKNSKNFIVKQSYEAAKSGGNPTPVSYSSQNSNTPTAQTQPITNNGRVSVGKYNICGPVRQFNPTEGNENIGEFTVAQTYNAAEPVGNPIRDIQNGTGQPLGGNLIRDIPIDEVTIQPRISQSVPVNEAREGNQETSAWK